MTDLQKIPLKRRDGSVRAYALVDDVDYIWLFKLPWHVHSHQSVYAARTERSHGLKDTILMHRSIMGLRSRILDPREVDHLNGDGLDNRRQNLRIVPIGANPQNVRAYKNNTTGFRGVSLTRSGKYQAKVQLNGKAVYLGSFNTPDEAAKVAAAWRAEHMPFTGNDDQYVDSISHRSVYKHPLDRNIMDTQVALIKVLSDRPQTINSLAEATRLKLSHNAVKSSILRLVKRGFAEPVGLLGRAKTYRLTNLGREIEEGLFVGKRTDEIAAESEPRPSAGWLQLSSSLE